MYQFTPPLPPPLQNQGIRVIYQLSIYPSPPPPPPNKIVSIIRCFLAVVGPYC